jgi:hypothetical protein
MYLQTRCQQEFDWMNGRIAMWLFMFFTASCDGQHARIPVSKDSTEVKIQAMMYGDSLLFVFENHPEFCSNGFDFPVGKPDAKGYYNAQAFQVNNHLGDDWNGRGGGNTDFGDTVFAVSNGMITQSVQFFGGWGKVVRQACLIKEKEIVEVLYAHCDQLFVSKGDFVVKGQPIGTIGNAEGKYLAHLHLEIRDAPGNSLGQGYSNMTTGYFDPTLFIKRHRKIGVD